MRSRWGVSETVAALALIVAAVAISAVVALFLLPFTRDVSTSEKLEVSAVLKTLPAGSAVLRVTVQNLGSSHLTLTGASLVGQNVLCTAPSPFSLPPGKSAELLLDCTGVSKYGKYVVSVQARTPSGNNIETQVPVMAE